MSRETFEVQLAIYDLSRGMARNLSAQFLGPEFAIDAIPHTGIVVYGREYFFGAGIQSESPDEFRRNTGMIPIGTQTLGRTTVTRVNFEEWCIEAMRNGSYSANSYDLLTRNCNNFSHEAALQGLQLSRGVPQWILDVPRRFLSSPMGQMVRPMLENMQLTNVGGAMPVGHFRDAATARRSASGPAAPVPVVDNPWASIPPQSSSSTSDAAAKTTKLLDSFTRPLLSNDTKTVSLCVKKLIPMAGDDEERDGLEQVETILSKGETLSEELADKACAIILRCLEKASHVTFALMLLRIIVLKSPNSSKACIDWLQSAFAERDNTALRSPTARSTGWLAASNTVSTPLLLSESLETFVDAAIRDIALDSQPRVEIRQAACAMLYNIALVEGPTEKAAGDELPDLVVSILCASFDRLSQEPDATAKLRRLMAAGRILKPIQEQVNTTATSLVQDLGFVDSLKQVQGGKEESGDAGTCQKLAAELLSLLQW